MAAKRTGGALFLTGDKKLDKIIRGLPFGVQGRILRTALKKAAAPVVTQSKATVPKDTGRTAKRIRTWTTKPRRDGSRAAIVGVKGPARGLKSRPNRAVALMKLIELGDADTPGKLTLRTALSSRSSQTVSIIKSELATGIVSEAKKLGR